MRARWIALLALSVLAVVACGAQDPGVSATRSRQDDGGLIPDDPTTSEPGVPDPETTTTAPLPVEEGIIDFGAQKPERSYDGYLVAAIQEIQTFWNEEFATVYGGTFDPLAGGIFASYPERTEPIPGCGTAETTYADVQGNAFYCIDGDFMAYDDAELLPDLVDELGEAAVAVVLAHEFGHAVQSRADNWGQPVILKEQQADCFAGAWAAHASQGVGALSFSDNDVRRGLVAMIFVRDPVEIGGSQDPNAHGTGFDRVGAFQDGFQGGAVRCEPFFTEGRESDLIDIPFDFTDPNLGDLPLRDPAGAGSDIITLLPLDLDRYWGAALAGLENGPFVTPTVVAYPQEGPYPPCEGVADDQFPENIFYCTATNEIMLDEDYSFQIAQDPQTKVGDLAVGYRLGVAYSEAVQIALESGLVGEQRALLSDCLTGSWVLDIVPPIPTDRESTLQLSAGDLDEAVITAIVIGDENISDDVIGSSFEKVDSFRDGVLGGLEACTANLAP